MPETTPSPLRRALVLSDGAAGNENQALALATALAPQVETIRLDARAPWRWFAPRRLIAARHAFGHAFAERLHSPWPDVAIGCGRQAALATRLLRDASNAACRTVQILDPRIATSHYDVVVAPRHDALSGDNVITTLGGLNRIDDTWLEQARARFPELAQLPGPRHAVLLGGSTRTLMLDHTYWNALRVLLHARLLDSGGSLMLTSSRRTPDWLRRAARDAFADVPGVQWHGPKDGPNPYAGFLAHASEIFVTPDSVNMLSEAAATRATTFTFAPMPLQGKVGHFVEALCESGRVAKLDDPPRSGIITPLRETARVAAQIRARFGWE